MDLGRRLSKVMMEDNRLFQHLLLLHSHMSHHKISSQGFDFLYMSHLINAVKCFHIGKSLRFLKIVLSSKICLPSCSVDNMILEAITNFKGPLGPDRNSILLSAEVTLKHSFYVLFLESSIQIIIDLV